MIMLDITFVSRVDFAANTGATYDRKSLGVIRARQFWRDNARPHATRTLQRVPNDEMNTMQKLNEAMPTSDDPAPVLLVEDDDCSMFNKYKRTMLMLHFVNSNVDEMTAPEMKTKWKELLKGDDVVSKSTFVKYKPFNIRKVCAAPLNAQLCARF
jgi:hypothetical protein